MTDRVHMSEDKVRRKDLCWSVRAVYILEKLLDVSGTLQNGIGARFNIKHVLRLFKTKVFVFQKPFSSN